MNDRNPDARKLTYIDFPTAFVWKNSPKQWTTRERKFSTVGRIHYISPSAGQKFYMRILLNVVKGATCFEDIRTVDGIVYKTYKDACYARGLLDDDKEYIGAITEVSKWGSGFHLRRIFTYLLASESLSRPHHVWLETCNLLADGILDMQRRILQRPGLRILMRYKNYLTPNFLHLPAI